MRAWSVGALVITSAFLKGWPTLDLHPSGIGVGGDSMRITTLLAMSREAASGWMRELHDGTVRRGDVTSGEDVDGLDLVGATVDVRSGEGLC